MEKVGRLLPMRRASVELEVFLAETRLQEAERLRSQAPVSPESESSSAVDSGAANSSKSDHAIMGEQFALRKAQMELKLAKLKLRLFDEDAVVSRMEELENLVQMREADVKIAKVNLQAAAERLSRAREEMDKCTVRAPVAGRVVHYRPDDNGGRQLPGLREGCLIRAGQRLVRIEDPTKMIMKLHLNDLQKQQLRTGMPAEARIDALPDLTLKGTIEEVFHAGFCSQPVYQLAFTPDGESLAVADTESPIQFVDLTELRRQLAEMGLDW
jgi:multidrug resistance efflux pump